MSANWYSIRTKLENQEIYNEDKDNQFLAAVVSSYPCLDIWVRPSNDREIEIRFLYIQKDSGYIAVNPWERTGENPKVWKQYRGTWQATRDWIVGVLPDLSRLHAEKRHGLANFGGANPYDGGGMVVNINDDGTVSILGRFGVLTVTIDGVVLGFNDIAWDFDGCVVEATVNPPGGWTGGSVTERPVQNTGGANSNTFSRLGTFDYVISAGYLEAYAPSYTTGDFITSRVAEWTAGVAQTMPLGSIISVNDPVLINDHSYSAGQSYPNLYGQSFIELTGNCGLAATGPNTFEGRLTVGFPQYLYGKETVTMLDINDNPSLSPSAHYRAAGGVGIIRDGTLSITRSDNLDGTWSFLASWVPDTPGVSASFVIADSDDPRLFSCYLSSGFNTNGVQTAYANAVSNDGSGTETLTTLVCNTDTLGFLSVPPPGTDFPFVTPLVDTDVLNGYTFRHQITGSLPS